MHPTSLPSGTRSLLITLTLVGLNLPAPAHDWPQWRGPDRDGRSRETNLLRKWPAEGPPLAWKVRNTGEGFSSLSIANGIIYTLGDLRDGCHVIALKEADGSPAWKTRTGESGGHRGYPGPRSTPTVDDGQIFALDQHSNLVCLNTGNGEKVWSVNLQDDFGGKMMSGWRWSESPLVDGESVICTPGGSKGTVLALSRKTGKKLWQTSEWTDPAGYSSVIIATIHGVRQYVQLTGQSVAGIDPKSGKVLWRADRPGKTAVITTPVIRENIVWVTSAYGVGCNAFRIDRKDGEWSTEEIYASRKFSNHHGGAIELKGHVFGSSGGNFACMDIKSGELSYRERSVGKGSTVYADGHFYLRSENGPMSLIEISTEKLKEVSSFEQPGRSEKKAWPHPVIANGKLYLRDQDLLLCYDISAK
ncbi:MAG: PQQ-like beta-propeller repeat protein [Roseibacillus sp.]|nr:PQQ-like beta-propeller repeat protein [Roseibacillus sp.]